MFFLLIPLLVLLGSNNVVLAMEDKNEKNARAIYAHISQKDYEDHAKLFYVRLVSPFDPLRPENMFKGGVRIRFDHVWQGEDLDATAHFLLRQRKVAHAILDQDTNVHAHEINNFFQAHKLSRNYLTGAIMQAPTMHQRLSMCYPVALATLFKVTGDEANVPAPPVLSLVMHESWWKASNVFSKMTLKILKRL